MASFDNLAIEELKMLTKARCVDDYENMSKQQLERISTTLSSAKLSLKPKLGPKKRTPMPAPKPPPRPKNLTPTPIPKPQKLLNIPRDCKPKKIAGSFDDKYIEHESEDSEGLSFKQYLDKIRQYLGDIIHDLRTLDEWKV